MLFVETAPSTSRAARLASVRCAVSVYEPARVGTPLRTPSEPRLSPGGAPAAIDQPYGAWPPLAASAERNGIPTSAAVREAVAVSATTLSVNCRESVRVTLSESLDVTVTVNV